MHHKQYLLILIYLAQGVYFLGLGPKNSENYGPYDIDYKSFELIKGPKKKSITVYNFTLYKQQVDYCFHCNLTFLEQGRLEEVKIIVYTVKDDRQTLLWSYRVTEPCNHFAIAPVIERYMHANNCVIKKGVYIVDINYTEITRQFFGGSFFYGEYIMKIYTLTKNANIMGFLINQVFKKKTPHT